MKTTAKAISFLTERTTRRAIFIFNFAPTNFHNITFICRFNFSDNGQREAAIAIYNIRIRNITLPAQ
jgi:hypothetical protein